MCKINAIIPFECSIVVTLLRLLKTNQYTLLTMNRFRYLIVIIFSLFITYTNAQGLMQLRNRHKVKIPFEYLHNLIIIPVEVNGTPLNFIVDTGSANTIIFALDEKDSLTINNPKNIKIRGLGGDYSIDAIYSDNNQMKISNIVGLNQTVYVVIVENFDLSAKVGKTIHGIIGNELLKNFVVTIDYHSKIMTFEQPDYFKMPNSKKFTRHPLIFYQNKPYLKGNVQLAEKADSIPVLMLIDSGNSDALWLFEDIDQGIQPTGTYFLDHLGEGFSGKIEGKRSKIQRFSFGDYTFNRPTIAFLDSVASKFARTNTERNGSVGSQILNRFKIILDYPKRQMFLKKSVDFDKEFRYNRAGIELYYYGKTLVKNEKTSSEGKMKLNEDNTVKFVIDYQYEFRPLYAVFTIQDNSPAAIAGIRKNDILLKINGKNTSDYSLEEVQTAFFGEEGKRISLLIERNGMKLTFEFTLREKL